LTGVRGEIEARFRDQLERILAGMDLVSREEFEAVKAMAAKAREEQELLQQRVGALEGRLAGLGPPCARQTGAEGAPQIQVARLRGSTKYSLAGRASVWHGARQAGTAGGRTCYPGGVGLLRKLVRQVAVPFPTRPLLADFWLSRAVAGAVGRMTEAR